MIEWYVDAIIAYVAIHTNLKINQTKSLNQHYSISFDSKNLASEKQVAKLDNTLKAAYLNQSQTFFNNLFNINNVHGKDIPKNIDIFTYSFPCQDLSIQGKQKGIDQKNKTRSGLLWEIKRIFQELQKIVSVAEMPKYLILENVKNITSIKHVKNFEKWLKNLKRLGYNSKTYILNAADFGSPQNRERVFCISIQKDFQKKIGFDFEQINFLKTWKKDKTINSIIQKKVLKKYYLPHLDNYQKTAWIKTRKNIVKTYLKNYTNFHSEGFIYNPIGKGPTLTASGANSRIKIIDKKGKIRLLTPLENFLYMGFSKKEFEKIAATNLVTETKMTYTAGNAISIEVLEQIFKKLKF